MLRLLLPVEIQMLHQPLNYWGPTVSARDVQEPLQLCNWLDADAIIIMRSQAGLTLLDHGVAASCQQDLAAQSLLSG